MSRIRNRKISSRVITSSLEKLTQPASYLESERAQAASSGESVKSALGVAFSSRSPSGYHVIVVREIPAKVPAVVTFCVLVSESPQGVVGFNLAGETSPESRASRLGIVPCRHCRIGRFGDFHQRRLFVALRRELPSPPPPPTQRSPRPNNSLAVVPALRPARGSA